MCVCEIKRVVLRGARRNICSDVGTSGDTGVHGAEPTVKFILGKFGDSWIRTHNFEGTAKRTLFRFADSDGLARVWDVV